MFKNWAWDKGAVTGISGNEYFDQNKSKISLKEFGLICPRFNFIILHMTIFIFGLQRQNDSTKNQVAGRKIGLGLGTN